MRSKIFGACFLGAVVGSALALQISPSLLGLAIGVLVGAAIGYVAAGPKTFLIGLGTCFAAAWRTASGRLTLIERGRLMESLMVVNGAITALSAMVSFAATSYFFWSLFDFAELDPNTLSVLALLVGAFIFLGLMIGILFAASMADEDTFLLKPYNYTFVAIDQLRYTFQQEAPQYEPEEILKSARREGFKAFLYVNWVTGALYGVISVAVGLLVPVALALLICFLLGLVVFRNWPEIIDWFKALPDVILEFARTFVHTFLAVIHSEVRVTCSACAAVGVVIGWAGQSPALGGVSGGVAGVVFYTLAGLGLRLLPKGIDE